ncbi:hypothetical protein JTB14_017067 [Gonioctena quinquepunctata]|nr:hypothetical protein JTB14_017067 [Gonioctena quinquepunctata]
MFILLFDVNPKKSPENVIFFTITMGLIFGKKKKPSRVTEQDKAILQLKQQRDKLKQYQKNCIIIEAKLLLRKKRYQEQLLTKTDCQLDNLEKLTHDIEFVQVELEVVEGLKIGNEALKKVNDALNIDDIESILEETREGIEKQNEISDLLSGKLTDEDEEAVEEELAAIISEQLPKVPTEEPAAQDEEEESAKEKERRKD